MSKSPSLRRIQADIRELSIDPSDRYHASPLENDMFEWHFTIRGAGSTDFEGGYYHGRILLPAEYPFKPPNIVFLTPSGRFETNTKVCLSFSAYHPELWQPAWGIRLILEALVSFLPTKGDGAIGSLDWTSEERKRLAKKSVDFCCPACGKCSDILKRIEKKIASRGNTGRCEAKSRFQKEIEQLHVLQMTNHDDANATKDTGDDEVGKDEETNKDEGVEKNDSEKVEEINGEQAVEEDDEEVLGDESCERSQKKNVTSSQIAKEDVVLEAAAEEISEEEKQTTDAEENKIRATQDDQAQAPETEPLEEATLDDQEEREHLQSPFLSDPVIHTGIIVFSIIVWLLVRKLTAVIEEMHALEAEIRELR